jgi:phosphoribosylanthranilate isomerase
MSANATQPLVKICGLREPEHARVAVEAGADLIGVVFYPPSHRNVSPREARAVADAARELGSARQARVVGLFVNEQVDTMNAIADEVGLDLIQLSGTETPEIATRLTRPVIGTVRAHSDGHLHEEARFQEWVAGAPWAVLLDSHVPGMYGGTGTVADWFLAADFARRYRVVLAGGLTPASVARAIQRVRPFAVDVSSGVETERRKDPVKIRRFVAAARGAVASEAVHDAIHAGGRP